MKKLMLVVVLASLLLVGTSFAQDVGDCNLEAPSDSAEITLLGVSYPLTDFFAEEFEACSDVDNLSVDAQMFDSGGRDEQLNLALSGETSPYGVMIVSSEVIPNLAQEGWLEPLDGFIEAYSETYDLGDISDAAFAAGSYDGVTYGIPFEVNALHFYYNTEILGEAGVEPPTTYDELIAACAALEASDADFDIPFTMNLHAGWAWRIEFRNFLASYGGELFDENNMPIFNGEEGVAALTKMMEVVDGCMGSEGLIYSIDDSQAGLQNGGVAMASIWATRSSTMDDPDLSDVVGLIEYAPALFAEDGAEFRSAIPYTTYFVIPSNTDVDKDVIFQVIMEAVDADSQANAASLGLVSRGSAAEADGAIRNTSATVQTIDESGPSPLNPAISLAHAALDEFLPLVGTGELTPQEALDAAAEKYIEEATAQGYITE